jgi:hypothetical protein
MKQSAFVLWNPNTGTEDVWGWSWIWRTKRDFFGFRLRNRGLRNLRCIMMKGKPQWVVIIFEAGDCDLAHLGHSLISETRSLDSQWENLLLHSKMIQAWTEASRHPHATGVTQCHCSSHSKKREKVVTHRIPNALHYIETRHCVLRGVVEVLKILSDAFGIAFMDESTLLLLLVLGVFLER